MHFCLGLAPRLSLFTILFKCNLLTSTVTCCQGERREEFDLKVIATEAETGKSVSLDERGLPFEGLQRVKGAI